MNEIVVASSSGPIRLDAARPVFVPLPTGRPPASVLAAGPAFLLRVERLSARAQPGTTYRVYFGLERTPPDDAHFVSTINFFSAVPLDGAVAAAPVDLVFDVTTIAARVARESRAADVLGVTIVADAPPEAGSDAAIRSIRFSRR